MPTGLPPAPSLIFSTRASACLEQRVAVLLQRLAALVDRDRLGERHVAALEPADDLLELLQRLLEGQLFDAAAVSASAMRLRSSDRRAHAFISAATWAATESARPSDHSRLRAG